MTDVDAVMTDVDAVMTDVELDARSLTPAEARVPRAARWLAAALCLLCVALIYGGRWIGPNDLYRKDQGKTMAYTVDVIRHARFSLPRDPIFQPATKPPLYNWLAAAFCGPTGIYDEWAHKLPSMLAALAVAAMLYAWCRRNAIDPRGDAALLALFAATIWIASKSTILLLYIARPDMLQAACLVAAWLAGHEALARPAKRDATRWAAAFWLGVTAAAMAKGPAAVYPILYVLLAAPLLFGSWRRLANLRWAVGLPVLLGTVGAWLACAARQDWPHVRDVLIGSEVLKRIAVSRVEGGSKPWDQSIIWFVTQNTVWSYLMLGSIGVSLLGSIRRLLLRRTRIPACRSTEGRADDEDSNARTHPMTGRNACPTKTTTKTERCFDLLRIRPTDGLFTGVAGAANLWAIVVVACLSVPKDKRMDFLLPAHAAAAILAAHFVVFLIARFAWTRVAMPLAAAVFLLDERRTVADAYVYAALAVAVAVVGLAVALRRRPVTLAVLFAVVAVPYLAFEVLTNTRLGIARFDSPTLAYVTLILGAGVVATLGIAAFGRLRLEVPLVAFGILFWSYALLQNGYKETNLPQRKGATGVMAVLGAIYSPDPNSPGTGPGVYAARFAKEARAIVGDDDPLVLLVRSKSPILSLMGRHQGSGLTRADFARARWVIAEESKFIDLYDGPQEVLFSGILDVDYGSISGTGDIYKDRLGLYRIERGQPGVDRMISIFRWVMNWTTRDANPYRGPNTGWVEGPGDPPIWTPPAGDPWTDARMRKKGGTGDLRRQASDNSLNAAP